MAGGRQLNFLKVIAYLLMVITNRLGKLILG